MSESELAESSELAGLSGPIAAIDCGTNTIKLLVGNPASDPAGVRRESRMVRLGQGVDATGVLAPEALERAFAAIDEYAAFISAAGVPADRIRFCATSATRDAGNAAEFTAGVLERLGVEPEVLSGEEEAALAFDGAVRGVRASDVVVPGPLLVIDVGGGSTELILGDPLTGPTAAHSMNVGSVRLHERHVRHDPIDAVEIAAIVADIDAALDACPVDPAAAAGVIAVAGTSNTLAAGALHLHGFDPAQIHASTIPAAEIQRVVGSLLGMSVAERRELGWMHPGRADVIDAGALVVSRVLGRLDETAVHSITISVTDILDGIAWSLLPK